MSNFPFTAASETPTVSVPSSTASASGSGPSFTMPSAQVWRLANTLTNSIADQDRKAFLAVFAPEKPVQRLGAQWYDNLIQFDNVNFKTSVGDTLIVNWSVPGDYSYLVQSIEVSTQQLDGHTVIMSVEPREDQPYWASSPVSVTSTSVGTLIADTKVSAAKQKQFVSALEAAVTNLENINFGSLDDDWNGKLVVDIPGDAVGYTRTGGDTDSSAAITTCDAGSARIVINPEMLSQPPEYLSSLVLHEAVHVATRACEAAYPSWVIEGLAELVIADAFPSAADEQREYVIDYLDRNGMPSQLPKPADFTTDSKPPLAFYALAAVAVDAVIEQLGQATALDMLTTGGDEEARVIQWYLAALQQYE